MITLKALMEKVVIISDQGGNFSRDMDKESNDNDRNQKHATKNKEGLQWAYC